MPQSATQVATTQFLIERPCKEARSAEDLEHLMPFCVWVESPGVENNQTGHKCKSEKVYVVSEQREDVGARLGGYFRLAKRGVVCDCMGRVIE